MKEIFNNYWLLICIILAAVLVSLLIVFLLSIHKKRSCNKDNSIIGVPLPQNTAHTLMTDATLELVSDDRETSFEVEYEITFVHSEEVISL